MSISDDFFDDFNRADGAVGNGWSLAPDEVEGTFEIRDNVLTTTGQGGYGGVLVGIYRPVDLTGSVTISADLTPTNGFGGLQLRWTTGFIFGGDGTTDTGYGIQIYRGDENYDNSAILLIYNGTVLEQLASTFQFGAHLHLEMTIAPGGLIRGTVSSTAQSFTFEFEGISPTYSGSNFLIYQEMGDSVGTHMTVDNLLIDIGSNGTQAPLLFQQPLESEPDGIFSDRPDNDGWTLTRDFGDPVPGHGRDHSSHKHFHLGEDWVPDRGRVIGTDVYAVADGTIVFAGMHPQFGNIVVIAHDVSNNGIGVDTVYSLYAHLNTISVFEGEIERGQMLGEIGKTGNATRPHLHWEMFSADWEEYLSSTLAGSAEQPDLSKWFDPTDFVSDFAAPQVAPPAMPTADLMFV